MTPYETKLTAYVDGLLAAMTARGFTIIHAGDLRATRDADLCHGKDPARALARAEWVEAETDRHHRTTLESTAYGLNGFICWPQKRHTGLCALPDRDGAARRFAAAHHLDYARLRAGGVTDADVFAVIATHEASHAMGNNGVDEEGPTTCEYSAYALHTARLLRAGMNPDALTLVNHGLAVHSFMAALRNPNDTFAYDRILGGAAWAAQNIHDPTVWDEDTDAFTPEAYDCLRAQALWIHHQDNTALHESLRALNRTRMLRGVSLDEDQPGFASKFCRAADTASARLRAQGQITAHGPDDKLQAALLLRQATRGFRDLSRFSPA